MPPARKTPSATASGLIEVGQEAPAFPLPDQRGQLHQLQDYRGKWVVLYFYPKDDTSGCTKEACQFRDQNPQFKKRESVILGVSPDSSASHLKFVGKYDLPFVLLADQGSKICSSYGVWQQKSMYGRKYMGVVRTTYLIDPMGKVAYRWDKVSVTDHDKQVIEKLDQLRGGLRD